MSKVRPVGRRGVLMTDYIPQNTELSWQKAWDDAGIFNVEFNEGNPKFYCLEMYPYPSGRCIWGTSEIIQSVMRLLVQTMGFDVLYRWDSILWYASREVSYC